MPLTCQLTAELGEPFTEAVNCCVPKLATVADVGDTLTAPDEPPLAMVKAAVADLVESACETAVTLTGDALGTADGAVYKPMLLIEPLAAPPTTLQVTPVFDVPVTVAVNCCVLPTLTVAAAGATETETAVVVLLEVAAQPENRIAAQIAPIKNGRRPIKVLTEGEGFLVQKRGVQSGLRLPVNWTTPGAKKMLGWTLLIRRAQHARRPSIHVAPVGSHTEFHFQRNRQLVDVLHLFAH